MKSKRSFIHFNAGEWSPKAEARVDHAKYPAACRQLQNAIPMPHGPVSRRKGFQFIVETKDSTMESRLMRFQFSRDVTFCIEAGDLYFRFIREGAQIESGGNAYEVATPYLEAEVKQLQFAQVNDVLFIVHQNHAPRLLSRLADDSWTLEEVGFDYPTLLDENVDISKKLALSATEGTGVTMTATGHTPFTADHVGSYWHLGHHVNEVVEVKLDLPFFPAGTESAPIFIVGKFTVETTGRWDGDFDLEQSVDEAFTSPSVIRNFESGNDKNYNSDFESPIVGAWYRLKSNAIDNNSGDDDRARIIPADAIRDAIVKVTAFSSSTSVTVDVVRNALNTDATDLWSEGAFSDERGFPQAVTFFENRILYAATEHQPQTFWGSKTDDYFNFKTGEEDVDSYAFSLASPERNEILWMGSTQQLLIGTSAGEWLASGNDVDTSITPTSIIVRKHSSNGSLALRPMLLEGTLAYMQRGGRKLRAMSYDGTAERFASPDLSILSDHITAGGVTSMAYQAQRDSLIWATTGLGKLIGMTHEPDQGVVAWHRHETQGNFEWVETIYGDGDDEVYVIVQRQIEGVAKRYIESFRGYYNPTVDNGGRGNLSESSTGSISIAFVIDTSGSMAANITATVAALSTIAVDMEARYSKSKFALIRYEADVETKTDFTDAATVIALMEALTTAGSDEFAYDAIVHAAETLDWDVGLSEDNIVYLATDEPDTGSTETTSSCIAALQLIGCRFVYGEITNAGFDTIVSGVGGYNFTDFDTSADDFINNVPLAGYSEDATEQRFVDSSVSYAASPATVFAGLDHLEGETVQILADGGVVPEQVVSGGSITIPVASSVVHVGLKYETFIQPMRIDIDSRMGIMQAKEKNIYEAVLYLMDTGAVSVKASGDLWDKVRDSEDGPLYGEAMELFTGETAGLSIETGSSTDPTFILRADQPLPFTLVAAILKYNLTGE